MGTAGAGDREVHVEGSSWELPATPVPRDALFGASGAPVPSSNVHSALKCSQEPHQALADKNRVAPGSEVATSGKVTDATAGQGTAWTTLMREANESPGAKCLLMPSQGTAGRFPDAWQRGEQEEKLLKTDPGRHHRQLRKPTVLENQGQKYGLLSTHISKLRNV